MTLKTKTIPTLSFFFLSFLARLQISMTKREEMEGRGSEDGESGLLICMTYIYQYCHLPLAWSFTTFVYVNDLGVYQQPFTWETLDKMGAIKLLRRYRNSLILVIWQTQMKQNDINLNPRGNCFQLLVKPRKLHYLEASEVGHQSPTIITNNKKLHQMLILNTSFHGCKD